MRYYLHIYCFHVSPLFITTTFQLTSMAAWNIDKHVYFSSEVRQCVRNKLENHNMFYSSVPIHIFYFFKNKTKSVQHELINHTQHEKNRIQLTHSRSVYTLRDHIYIHVLIMCIITKSLLEATNTLHVINNDKHVEAR